MLLRALLIIKAYVVWLAIFKMVPKDFHLLVFTSLYNPLLLKWPRLIDSVVKIEYHRSYELSFPKLSDKKIGLLFWEPVFTPTLPWLYDPQGSDLPCDEEAKVNNNHRREFGNGCHSCTHPTETSNETSSDQKPPN